MRKVFIAVLLLMLKVAAAQTKLDGLIKDNKNNPVANASVSVKDSYDGSTTDAAGRFSFTTADKGEQTIIVSAIGYKNFEQKVTLDGKEQQLTIVLKEEITELKAVVISAGSFEASDRKKGTVLTAIDIVTTATNGDITTALKTLPGAQQVGESEGLFVRGGTAAETKTFIDGTLVNNFFFSSVPGIAQRGRFSPFIFKGTVFSTGGYSALYGQALSAAVILESIDLPDQSSANFGITVIGGSAGFQQLAKNKKSSWGVNYGYTNLWLAFKAIKQQQSYTQVPQFHNGDANFRIKTSKTGMLKYYGYLSTNKLGFRTNSIDTLGYNDVFKLSNINIYHNLSYKEFLGKGWRINAGVSYTNNKDNIEGNLQNERGEVAELQGLQAKNFTLLSKANYANAKLVFEKRWTGLTTVRFGMEDNYSEERPVFETTAFGKVEQTIKENITAAFAETDVYLTNAVAAKVGARAEHSTILQKVNVAPRVSVAYKLSNASQASLAYGVFYQSPETRYLPAISGNLTYAKATHYIAQYQKIANNRTLRAEAFYKKYDNLLKTDVRNNRNTAASSNGMGDAKGFEVFWRDRKSIKGVDYWLSYSYLDTKRDFLNFPYPIQPDFAARHTGSVVVKKFISNIKTQFNGSYIYSSGRPYYRIENTAGGSKFADRGLTPDFHTVGFSVNYLPNLGSKKNFTVFVFSMSNVFGFDQVFNYRYSYNGFRKEAVVPPSRRFLFLGAFITLGVDRTEDIINSNL